MKTQKRGPAAKPLYKPRLNLGEVMDIKRGDSDMRLLNAFSLSMISHPAIIETSELTVAQTQSLLAEGFESAVGHADTAAVFGEVLGVPVTTNRVSILLEKGEEALVGQYAGPRLPEGATQLPEGATIKWLLVAVR